MRKFTIPFILALSCRLPCHAEVEYHLSGWCSYTGFNIVNDIAVGRRFDWFGTDGGLLRYDKKTKTWRRFTLVDGLPVLYINAVTIGLGRNPDIWFFASDYYANVWVGYFSPRNKKAASVRFPFYHFAPWKARLHLIVSHRNLRILALFPPIHAREFVCNFHLRNWREIPLTSRQQLEINQRYPSIAIYNPEKVLAGNGIFYILGGDYLAIYEPKTGCLSTYPLPTSRRLIYSIPFRFRIISGGLLFDMIASCPITYPIGVVIYNRKIITFRFDRFNGRFQVVSRRIFPENGIQNLVRKLEVSHRPPVPSTTSEVDALASDGRFLWLAGNFRPLGFDRLTGKWIHCPRLPGEVPIGQNTLINFTMAHGRLTVPTNGPYRYSYDSRTGAWLREKQPPPAYHPRWLKAKLPSSPAPNAPLKEMWGLISAETPHYRWITFGAGAIYKTPGIPYAYCQAPARVGRQTGKVRFFHELWGYWVDRVIPFGHGDAWLLAERVHFNMEAQGKRALFRYDSKTDTLRSYDPKIFDKDEPPHFFANDPAGLVTTAEGALFAITENGFGPSDAQRFLLAWSASDDQWRPVSLPSGWRLLKIFGGNGILAALLASSTGKHAFWIYNPNTRSLRKIALPARYTNFMPWSMHIGKRHLWFGGLYILRANRPLPR